MGPLPMHITMVATAQVGGGHLDERVGTALRRRACLARSEPVAGRIDRGLQECARLVVEQTLHEPVAPIALLTVEPAPLVGVVVTGEHTVRIQTKAGGLREGAHPSGVERLRSLDEDGLHWRHLLHADIAREVGDHRHVAEGGATRPGAVERGRHLAQGPCQVLAVGGSLSGHAAAMAQPGDRAQAAIVLPTPLVVKAVEAAQELSLEPIDRPPHVDHVLPEGERGEAVDGLTNECLDRLGEPPLRIRYCSRYHTKEYSNVCSTPYGRRPPLARPKTLRYATVPAIFCSNTVLCNEILRTPC